MQKQQQEYSTAEDQKNAVTRTIDDLFFVKQMNLENLLVAQKRAKLYDDATAGKLKVTAPRDTLFAQLLKQEQSLEKIREALTRLMSDNPKYQHWFKRLLEVK